MTSFLTQINGSGTGQYFADASGSPWMLKGDSVWGLIDNAGQNGGATTYQTDITNYCSTRSGQGFNFFLTTPVGTTQSGAQSNNGDTWDGVAPFSSPGVLNNTFWTRVDYLLTTAASYGMTVVLNVMFTYAMNGGPLDSGTWSNANYQSYGAALASRYGSTPNLIWEFGDDYGVFGEYYDTQFTYALDGLRGGGDTHILSIENLWDSTSRYALDGSTSFTWGIANAQFDWGYSANCPSYLPVEYAYTESSPILAMLMDGWYDGQTGTSESTELFMRKWAWWALSSGSRGVLYGEYDLFSWPSDALTLLTSNPFTSTSLGTIWTTFSSFTGWQKLVADTSSSLVTSGRGTHYTDPALGSDNTYTGGNNWVTASKTADKTLAVIYMPAHTTITINQSQMAAGYTASWVDPANGTKTSTAAGSSYTSSGTNSAGDADWLLVLQGPAAAPSSPQYLYSMRRFR